jgi:mannose-6-phosphate isomerase class I
MKSLSHMHCDDDITGNVSETDTANKKRKDPKPSPIYIYGVTDYKAMVRNLAQAVNEETYFTKTLYNNTVRISILSSETSRKLLRHIQDEKIIHHMYQIKQDRAYRVVIRDMHHSVSTNEIKNELN